MHVAILCWYKKLATFWSGILKTLPMWTDVFQLQLIENRGFRLGFPGWNVKWMSWNLDEWHLLLPGWSWSVLWKKNDFRIQNDFRKWLNSARSGGRAEFSNIMTERVIANRNNFCSHLFKWWEHFSPNRKVNIQRCRYWSNENPHWFHEVQNHFLKKWMYW